MKKILTIVLMIVLMSNTALAESEVVVLAGPDETNAYTEVFTNATEDDMEALRNVVYWESVIAGCELDVNAAVVETVLNRVISSDSYFPDTIAGVCKQRKQFVCKDASMSQNASQRVTEAIEFVKANGCTVLPGTDYVYFATKKQSCAKDHVWIGARKADGTPKKGLGMYFGRDK